MSMSANPKDSKAANTSLTPPPVPPIPQPVTMSFADPNTISAGDRMKRTVSSQSFAFAVGDKMQVRIGDGTFTCDYPGVPSGTATWLTGKFASDKKVSIDFNVAATLPPTGHWPILLGHTRHADGSYS